MCGYACSCIRFLARSHLQDYNHRNEPKKRGIVPGRWPQSWSHSGLSCGFVLPPPCPCFPPPLETHVQSLKITPLKSSRFVDYVCAYYSLAVLCFRSRSSAAFPWYCVNPCIYTCKPSTRTKIHRDTKPLLEVCTTQTAISVS